jgi:hypothetical protein
MPVSNNLRTCKQRFVSPLLLSKTMTTRRSSYA